MLVIWVEVYFATTIADGTRLFGPFHNFQLLPLTPQCTKDFAAVRDYFMRFPADLIAATNYFKGNFVVFSVKVRKSRNI